MGAKDHKLAFLSMPAPASYVAGLSGKVQAAIIGVMVPVFLMVMWGTLTSLRLPTWKE